MGAPEPPDRPLEALTADGDVIASAAARLHFPAGEPPLPGQARTLCPGVVWIRLPLPMALNHINVWLLEASDGWMLVDTGINVPNARAAWETLGPQLFADKPLKRIFITHFHPDHLGLAAWLQARYHVPVWMSRPCHARLSAHFAVPEGTPDRTELKFLLANGLADTEELRQSVLFDRYRQVVGEVREVEHFPRGGELLPWGAGQWQLSEHGGHAEGHLCLHDAKRGMLISGDQVLPSISPNVSIFATTPDPDPLGTFMTSLQQLAALPQATLVLPSHGLPFTGLPARLADVQRHHERQLERLPGLCKQPVSAADVALELYRRELSGFNRMLAVGEALAHLEYLAHRGVLRRGRGADGVNRYQAAGAP